MDIGFFLQFFEEVLPQICTVIRGTFKHISTSTVKFEKTTLWFVYYVFPFIKHA